MDFGYSGNFHLDSNAEEVILEAVKNGCSVKEAVYDWACGLEDYEYNIVQDKIGHRIVSYIESLIEED